MIKMSNVFDVSRRIFQDPEIFELELERIFESN